MKGEINERKRFVDRWKSRLRLRLQDKRGTIWYTASESTDPYALGETSFHDLSKQDQDK